MTTENPIEIFDPDQKFIKKAGKLLIVICYAEPDR
jgi:hypothetical protein